MGESVGVKGRQLRKPIAESNFRSPDVNAHFRQLDDGRTLFYPLGIFGRRGFVVASTEQEALLRANVSGARKRGAAVLLLNFLGMIAIGVFTPSLRLVPWPYAVYVGALLAARWLFLRFYSRHLTEGMESANMRNSPIVYWRSEGRTMSPPQLILRLVAAVGTAGISVALALRLKTPTLFVLSGQMAVWFVPLFFIVQGWLRDNRQFSTPYVG
ncbi:hypothetical protein ACFLSW_04135 [Candidatus Bipolaricaulota bacterium]